MSKNESLDHYCGVLTDFWAKKSISLLGGGYTPAPHFRSSQIGVPRVERTAGGRTSLCHGCVPTDKGRSAARPSAGCEKVLFGNFQKLCKNGRFWGYPPFGALFVNLEKFSSILVPTGQFVITISHQSTTTTPNYYDYY